MDLFENEINTTHKNVNHTLWHFYYTAWYFFPDISGLLHMTDNEDADNVNVLHDTTYMTVVILMRLINIAVHSFGSHLLITLQKKYGTRSLQNMFIIHLSIVEIMRNIFVLAVLLMGHPLIHTKELFRVQFSITVITSTTLELMYYLSMYYLTIDRLLALKLNIRYQALCTIRRAKYVLVTSWIVAIVIPICLIVFSVIEEEEFFIPPLSTITYLGLSTIYLFISITTYVLLFRSLRDSLATQTRDRSGNNRRHITMWVLFRKSKFIVSVCLIGSFLLMVVFPDIGYIVGYVYNDFEFPQDPALIYSLGIMIILSDLVDFFIYIFLQKKVKRLFFERLCCLRKRRPLRTSTILTRIFDRRKSSGVELNTTAFTLNHLG